MGTSASVRHGSGAEQVPPRRAARTLRYVNDELVRANEAIFRPAGTLRPGRPGDAARLPTRANAGAGGEGRPPEPAKAGAVVSAGPPELITGTVSGTPLSRS